MPNTLQDSWVTLMTITYVVVIVAVLVTVFRRRDRWEDPRSRWLQNSCIILVLMALFTGTGFCRERTGTFAGELRRSRRSRESKAGPREETHLG